MEHSFDIEYASKYGVKEAIMIKFLQYWIMKNQANKKHLHDGRTWTYNTCSALADLFPYWTDKQVRVVIQSLKDQNVILLGNWNETAYDRTTWYAFVDEIKFLGKGKCILLNGQMEITDQANQFDQKGEPIPVIIPDKEPIKETEYIVGSSPELKNQEVGTVTNLTLSDHTVSISGEKPKKEESSGKEERKLTGAEILFKFWISHKELIQHRSMSKTMEKVLSARIKEEGFTEIKECIIAYHTVLSSDKYFYTYQHNLDDFFRNGSVQKISPYRNFLSESKPLEKFLKNKKPETGWKDNEEDTYKEPPQVETPPDENKAQSLVLSVIKKLKGEEVMKYIAYARSSDIELLRQAYYLAKDKKYQECYNFMMKHVTLSFEDYKIEWDKRISGGW